VKTFHARLFGWLAPIYGRLWKPLVLGLVSGGSFAEEKEGLFALDRGAPPGPAVDVGCGPGTFTVEIARRQAPALVVGIDAARAMLRQGRREARVARQSNLAWLEADAEELPLRSGVVARVVCCGVLHLLPRPEKALREIARVLLPGGVLLGMTLVEGRSRLERAIAGALSRILRFRFFPGARFEAGIRSAGLELECTKRSRLMLLFRARKDRAAGSEGAGTFWREAT
jgi:SAM-dependent methyltransferase